MNKFEKDFLTPPDNIKNPSSVLIGSSGAEVDSSFFQEEISRLADSCVKKEKDRVAEFLEGFISDMKGVNRGLREYKKIMYKRCLVAICFALVGFSTKAIVTGELITSRKINPSASESKQEIQDKNLIENDEYLLSNSLIQKILEKQENLLE